MRTVILCMFCFAALTGSAQTTYSLTDASTLAIDGTSTIDDWTVTANSMEGTLQADSDVVKSVEFSVEVAKILSDRAAAMDNKMHEALKREEHPKIMFLAEKLNVSVDSGQDLKGILTVAGVENEVTIPVDITEKDGKMKLVGEQKIVLKDYGMEPPSAMFGSIVVGDEVTVKFDLMFAK